MKIKSVRIQNLRSFLDETIFFNDYTCLAGANGAGKSTVLCALNIFFRETAHSATDLTCLQEEDFHKRNTTEPVRITVTFNDLSDEAQVDFADYFRQGELVVTAEATHDAKTGKATVQQFGQRKGLAAFRPFFEAVGNNTAVSELKALYNQLHASCPELPIAGTKQVMINSLHDYEEAHHASCELIPSADLFYGFSKGVSRLAKYIQWVFVPAIKDASTEQAEGKDTALGKLLSRTVSAKINFTDSVQELQARVQAEYQTLMQNNQHLLNDLSNSLKVRLAQWSNPNATLKLQWKCDEGRAVRLDEPMAEIMAGEGAFEGHLSRSGHGLQRCYLLALLQELADSNQEGSPKLILGFEEPELFQHPPQAQHLSEILQGLAKHNSQIIVCTHSPYFVSGDGFEDMRVVRKGQLRSQSKVSQTSFEELATAIASATGDVLLRPTGQLAKIHQVLQPSLNEMFFTPFLVLLEGLEDVAYITTYLHLSDRWREWRRLGCHMVPVNKKSNMVQPLATAKLLHIPTYIVFDSDAHTQDKNGSHAHHKKDNKALLKLCGYADAEPMPSTTCRGSGITMWKSEMEQIVAEDYGHEHWKSLCNQANQKHGQAGGLNKNSLHIATMLELAWNAHGPAPALEDLCTDMITYANAVAAEHHDVEYGLPASMYAASNAATTANSYVTVSS